MDYATSAMERVPLKEKPEEPSVRNTIPQPPADARTETVEDGPSFLLPITRPIYHVLRALCHTLGAFLLRLLSILMLHGGIVAAVGLQMLAFYYTGVLNGHVFLACLFYAPSLGGMAVIRGHMLEHGTSLSGAGPRMSHLVALAYLAMLVSGICSVIQPVVLRMEGGLSNRNMWLSIAATGIFYYSLLVSEVLFATALNVKRAREIDEELQRRDREDPEWITGYQAVHSADV